ncbi:unnamed protein product [Urochloa humidicola]
MRSVVQISELPLCFCAPATGAANLQKSYFGNKLDKPPRFHIEYTMVWECLQKMMMDGCAWSVRGNSTCSCSSHIEVSFGIVSKRPWYDSGALCRIVMFNCLTDIRLTNFVPSVSLGREKKRIKPSL